MLSTMLSLMFLGPSENPMTDYTPCIGVAEVRMAVEEKYIFISSSIEDHGLNKMSRLV